MAIPSCILVIEDNLAVARALIVRMQQYWPPHATYYLSAATMAEGLTALETVAPDLIILDLYLPDSTGLDSVSRLVAACREIPIVAMSGYLTDFEGLETIRLGAEEYLLKGDTGSMLVAIMRAWLRAQRRQDAMPIDTRRP